MTPPRAWWVCLAAALPAHILLEIGAGFSTTLVGLLFLTNCSEALLAAIAVRALSDAPARFDSFRRVAAFIGGAGLLAPIVSSFADAAVVSQLRDESYWNVWRVRVFANVLTELSVVPAIILGWRAARRLVTHRPAARRVAEAIAFVVALTAIAVLVFGRPSLSDDAVPGTLPTPIVLLFPVFGWAAMRFGVGGVSAALLGAAFVASYETAVGLRPFATMTADRQPDRRPDDSRRCRDAADVHRRSARRTAAGHRQSRRQVALRRAAVWRFPRSFLRFPDDAVALRRRSARSPSFAAPTASPSCNWTTAPASSSPRAPGRGPGVVQLSAEAFRRQFPDAMTRVDGRRNGRVARARSDPVPPRPRIGARSRRSVSAILVILPFVAGHSVRGALALATTGERPVSATRTCPTAADRRRHRQRAHAPPGRARLPTQPPGACAAGAPGEHGRARVRAGASTESAARRHPCQRASVAAADRRRRGSGATSSTA